MKKETCPAWSDVPAELALSVAFFFSKPLEPPEALVSLPVPSPLIIFHIRQSALAAEYGM